ncbi:MAG: LytTR family DNA-binding domain-containing protein [Blastocatellia bacterium]
MALVRRCEPVRNEKHSINYRLRDLELRLDPARFLRLGRGVLVNVEMVVKVLPMPGGTYVVQLSNEQELKVSRLQSRISRNSYSDSDQPVPALTLGPYVQWPFRCSLSPGFQMLICVH